MAREKRAMRRYAYRRLDRESAAQLERETSRTFGHSGATLVFDAGPLARPDGGVDFTAVRAAIDACLHEVPHFRRKLRWIPIENHPIWVDDREFNLDYHVRHTSLPRPGSRDQLRKLAARLQSQRLDRSRPLWECWVVEGLEGGRFALLLKLHNALAEADAPDLLERLLSADPQERPPGPESYRPAPMPSAFELVRDELVRQLRLPRRLAERAHSLLDPEHGPEELRLAVRRIGRALGYSIAVQPDTPLDGPVGPHRRVDHLVLSLEDARRVRARLGGTIHHVLLATVAGAVGRYLQDHFVNPATLDLRVAVPVSPGDDDRMETWIVELPAWEPDPCARYARLRERTRELREAMNVLDGRVLAGGSTWQATRLLARAARSIPPRAPVNLRLVNVPGPQVPVYLAGARLEECFGKVPLGENGGLGIAVLSYAGKLCLGLNADFDLVADLSRFTAALTEEFESLLAAGARRPEGFSRVEAS